MLRVSNNDVTGASKIISLVKKYFMENTEVSKAYRVYSQLLYTESPNVFYASKFYSNLLKEYNALNLEKINSEVSALHRDITKEFSLREILSIKVPNYKLFASFNIMTEHEPQYLSSKDKMHCDNVVLEHLVHNKELKRLKESSMDVDIKDQSQIDTENIAFAIALKEFHKRYGGSLVGEQKNFIVKYYSSTPATFNNWAMKKVDNILDEISEARLKIGKLNKSEFSSVDGMNEHINSKLELVDQKLRRIKEAKKITSDSFVEVMMGFELCECMREI